MALATEPTGNVTVTISGHASTAVTLDKTTLTFTVGGHGADYLTLDRRFVTADSDLLPLSTDPSGRGELIDADPHRA